MSDTDATQVRQDVVANVDEILENVINANMLSMPYDVYYEIFDAVAGLGGEIENLQAENAKLRELVAAFDWCTENFDMPNKCDRCPLPQGNALEPECEVRMRELGVEATE